LTTLNVKENVGMSSVKKGFRRRARTVAAPENSVILYLRVSTSEQAASGLGIEAQRATAHAYADRKGLMIIDEFRDEGISAKTISGRPGASAALKAVRDEKQLDCWSRRWID
jgi:Resolvase, N terminal domain